LPILLAGFWCQAIISGCVISHDEGLLPDSEGATGKLLINRLKVIHVILRDVEIRIRLIWVLIFNFLDFVLTVWPVRKLMDILSLLNI